MLPFLFGGGELLAPFWKVIFFSLLWWVFIWMKLKVKGMFVWPVFFSPYYLHSRMAHPSNPLSLSLLPESPSLLPHLLLRPIRTEEREREYPDQNTWKKRRREGES